MRCGCGFCALCLADCGGDAHTHYGTTHGGDIFNRRLFDETHRTRRSLLIVDAVRALAGEGGDVQRAVMRELSVDMRGLTIDEGGVAAAVFQQRARAAAAAGAPGDAVANHVRDLWSRAQAIHLAATTALMLPADESGALADSLLLGGM